MGKSRNIEEICSTTPTHKMTQTVKFMFLNVSHRPTVYKTGCISKSRVHNFD